jgi:hypothetical protein
LDGVNRVLCRPKNLDGIGTGIGGRKLEAMAEFEHGENIRHGSAIVEPKASRCGVHKAAREAGAAGVLSREFAGQFSRVNAGPKGGENPAEFFA